MNAVSPCVGVCKLDEATGYCLGCARTGEEIAVWRDQSDAWRSTVWDALPERFETLGVTCRRLAWSTSDIRSFVKQSLERGAGTWVAGVVGAVGEFTAAPGQSTQVEVVDDTVTAMTEGGGLHFLIDDQVRALIFEPTDTPIDKARIVLAVKRERGRPVVADTLTHLGEDVNAVSPSNRAASLFDLGLNRKEARFCVRVEAGEARAALFNAEGSAFPANLPQIGTALLKESPVRVIETALGRLEVSSAIPAPGGVSPLGPHTHLLPDHLASERALPVGMDLPRAYLPGAIYCPAK